MLFHFGPKHDYIVQPNHINSHTATILYMTNKSGCMVSGLQQLLSQNMDLHKKNGGIEWFIKKTPYHSSSLNWVQEETQKSNPAPVTLKSSCILQVFV